MMFIKLPIGLLIKGLFIPKAKKADGKVSYKSIFLSLLKRSLKKNEASKKAKRKNIGSAHGIIGEGFLGISKKIAEKNSLKKGKVSSQQESTTMEEIAVSSRKASSVVSKPSKCKIEKPILSESAVKTRTKRESEAVDSKVTRVVGRDKNSGKVSSLPHGEKSKVMQKISVKKAKVNIPVDKKQTVMEDGGKIGIKKVSNKNSFSRKTDVLRKEGSTHKIVLDDRKASEEVDRKQIMAGAKINGKKLVAGKVHKNATRLEGVLHEKRGNLGDSKTEGKTTGKRNKSLESLGKLGVSSRSSEAVQVYNRVKVENIYPKITVFFKKIESSGFGRGKAVLKLHPPDLGEVNVEVRVKGKEVKMILRAEDKNVAEALKAQFHIFKQSMEKEGYKISHFVVFFETKEGESHGFFKGGREQNYRKKSKFIPFVLENSSDESEDVSILLSRISLKV